MTMQEMSANGIVDELANVIADHANARIVLESIGYPRRGRPAFNTSLDFWESICTQIAGGILATGNDLQPLVNAAAVRFPTNEIFSRFRTDHPGTSQPSGTGATQATQNVPQT